MSLEMSGFIAVLYLAGVYFSIPQIKWMLHSLDLPTLENDKLMVISGAILWPLLVPLSCIAVIIVVALLLVIIAAIILLGALCGIACIPWLIIFVIITTVKVLFEREPRK